MAGLDGHRPPGPEHGQVPLHGGGSGGRGWLDAGSGLSLSDEETGSGILEMNINAGNWS